MIYTSWNIFCAIQDSEKLQNDYYNIWYFLRASVQAQNMFICPALYSTNQIFHTLISGVRVSLASSNLITQRSHICVNLEVSDSRMDLKCTTVGPFLPLPSDCDCILYDLIIIEGWIIINDLKHHITLNRFLTSVIIVRVKLHSGPRKGSRLTFVVFHKKSKIYHLLSLPFSLICVPLIQGLRGARIRLLR